MNQLNGNTQIQLVDPNSGAAGTKTLSAGTTDVKSQWCNTVGVQTARFIVLIGAITSTGTIQFTLEHSDDQSTVVVETGITVNVTDANANQAVILEVTNPQFKNIRLSTDRGTANSALNGIIFETANLSDMPAARHSTVAFRATCQGIAN